MEEGDITTERETTLRMAEHEVLVSFNSDWMAEAFEEWLVRDGKKKFIKWAKGHDHWQKEFS